ncbi:MAG: histidinol dehydrogenase [Saprospiraceae bacterium]|jgi:histidinol dehydrogenase
MKIYKYPKVTDWNNLTKRPTLAKENLDDVVKNILSKVQKEGDVALFNFAKKFDKANLKTLKITKKEIQNALSNVPEDLKKAIQTAKQNIEKFHIAQREKEVVIETSKGVKCWRKSVPIDKVGLYIPGGTAPLFSTILMLGIPAQIAGCREIILCTPPNENGEIHPAILYTANLVGITQVFKVGGAQAVAAMAYGTETVPAVYKIFGPGNQYVTKAKELIQQEGVAIDMPAGPSEVLVIADASCEPSFVAADLLSQAEHGVDSQVILLSDSQGVIDTVLTEVQEQLQVLPRQEIATKALANSKAIVFKTLDESLDFSNAYAPEHLIIASEKADDFIEKITNAGSVFLGNYSCESAGDYASGTNHTLPTNGFARNYSGVSLDSFLKKITFQKLSKIGIQNLGPAIEIMAEAEGLMAHKNAVSVRLLTKKVR